MTDTQVFPFKGFKVENSSLSQLDKSVGVLHIKIVLFQKQVFVKLQSEVYL